MAIPQVRFGLVGAGRVGRDYVHALAESHRACLAAVADPRPDAARTVGADAWPHLPSAAAMIEAVDLDAVVVSTPPDSHADLCLQFISEGIPVLCEKPFTITVESAERLLGAARRFGVALSMASKFRWVDGVMRARELLESGALGELNRVEIGFTAKVDMRDRWNADRRISGGGVLIDNGSHAVDLLSVFLGSITEVSCVEGPRLQGLPVEETVRLLARGCTGAIGIVDLSWSLSHETDNFLCVYGTEGTVTVGWHATRCRLRTDAGWRQLAGPYDKTGAFVRQIDAFARTVCNEPSLSVTPDDAVASVRLVAAAYTALESGCWVPVDAAAAGTTARTGMVA